MKRTSESLLGLLFLGLVGVLVVYFGGYVQGWLTSVDGFLPIIVCAIVLGAGGSTSYYTALHFRMISVPDQDNLLQRFNPRSRVAWFAAIGGFVALVFQLAQFNSFAPVQSFVFGMTWPTLVSQYLSGKQTAPIIKDLGGL